MLVLNSTRDPFISVLVPHEVWLQVSTSCTSTPKSGCRGAWSITTPTVGKHQQRAGGEAHVLHLPPALIRGKPVSRGVSLRLRRTFVALEIAKIKSWRNPGEILEKSWRNPGEILEKSMEKSWRNPGEILEKSWRNTSGRLHP